MPSSTLKVAVGRSPPQACTSSLTAWLNAQSSKRFASLMIMPVTERIAPRDRKHSVQSEFRPHFLRHHRTLQMNLQMIRFINGDKTPTQIFIESGRLRLSVSRFQGMPSGMRNTPDNGSRSTPKRPNVPTKNRPSAVKYSARNIKIAHLHRLRVTEA